MFGSNKAEEKTQGGWSGGPVPKSDPTWIYVALSLGVSAIVEHGLLTWYLMK